MRDMDKLKEMLCNELDEFTRKGELSAGSLDAIHKLTDTIKNIDKIEMLDEVSDYSEYAERKSYSRRGASYHDNSYDDSGNSYARRRRDSMGRYARDGYDRGTSRNYSRAEAKDRIMNQIEDLMSDAQTEKERQVLQRAMQSLENA